MFLVLWVFVGAFAGWLAGKSLEGEGHGRSVDIALGIGGALLGGIVMRAFGFLGIAGTTFAALVAMTSGGLLTTVAALSNGRRVHTREL
jgi:uncharacterized membrane protein YeaQ/YmgE (transglycosylase-associated protein family)